MSESCKRAVGGGCDEMQYETNRLMIWKQMQGEWKMMVVRKQGAYAFERNKTKSMVLRSLVPVMAWSTLYNLWCCW